MNLIHQNNKFFPTIVFLTLLISFIVGNFFVNLIVLFASLYVILKIIKEKLKILNFDILLLFIFFFLIIFSSFIKSFDIKDLFLLKFLGICIFSYIYRENIIRNKKIINYFLIFIILFLSFDIFFQNIYGKNLIGFSKYQGSLPTGFFGDEKISGSYISKITILYLTFFFLNKKTKIDYTLCILVVFFSLVSIILSTERKAIFDLLIYFVLIFLLLPKKKTFFMIVSFIFLLASIVIVLPNSKSSIYKKTLIQFGIGSDKSLSNNDKKKCLKDLHKDCYSYYGIDKNSSLTNNQYFAHYFTSIQIWKDFPFFGAGNKKFRKYCSKEKYIIKKNVYSKSRCSTHPHNIYLTILSEHGIFGLLFFLVLIIRVLFNRHNYNKREFNVLFPLFLTLILPIPNGNIFSTWLGTFYWLTFGFLIKK